MMETKIDKSKTPEHQIIEWLQRDFPTTLGRMISNGNDGLIIVDKLQLISQGVQMASYYEQRSLIAVQKKATFWMKWATLGIAGATLAQVLIALFKK
jgi:hypothetical protein